MFALSIKQPWAWMIATGRKTIETRTWHVSYRGDLLIVSSKASMRKEVQKAFDEHFGELAFTEILYGKALAIARLDVCRPMTEPDQDAACCSVDSGTMAWVLKDIRPITPFDVHGQLGIYTVNVKHCINCGCVDENCSQCIEAQNEPCHWVENGKCSRCFDADGKLKESESME